MVVVSDLGPPQEGVRHTQPAVATYVNRKSMGMGTLYISEARVSWVGIQGKGFSLEYKHVALHAVSRDLTQFHQECLYLMIDVRLVDEEGTPMSTPNTSGDDESGDEGDSEGGMTEIRFVPDDASSLDSMFTAMSECQQLHPDTDDSISDAEEEEGMYDDAEEDGGANGDANGGTNGDGGGEESMDAE